MRYRNLLFLLAVAAFCGSVSAQTYQASHLREAAALLGIDGQTAALPPQSSSTLDAGNGQRLTVRTDKNGQVEHIGIPLFNPQMRTLMPSPIYDYLEFALLDHKYHISKNTLQQQRVVFSQGSWATLETIQETDECSIDNIDGKFYAVAWSRNAQPLVSLRIPINYELLANSSRREMESNFVRDLKAYRPPHPQQPAPVDNKSLKKYGTEGLYVLPGNSYLLPAINRNTYYKDNIRREKVKNIIYEEVETLLLFDARYPRESLANLLLTTAPQLPDASVGLEFIYDDYRRETVNVTLRQLLSFCQDKGCTPYYIYEDTKDDTATALLVLHNTGEGYDHIVYLRCSLASLADNMPDIKAKIYLYTPSNNVTKLFGDAPTGKSTPKKYE